MSKKKKNGGLKNEKPVVFKFATSSECEKCSDQCKEGLNYIKRIQAGRPYYGVKCHKESMVKDN